MRDASISLSCRGVKICTFLEVLKYVTVQDVLLYATSLEVLKYVTALSAEMAVVLQCGLTVQLLIEQVVLPIPPYGPTKDLLEKASRHGLRQRTEFRFGAIQQNRQYQRPKDS